MHELTLGIYDKEEHVTASAAKTGFYWLYLNDYTTPKQLEPHHLENAWWASWHPRLH